MHAKPERPPIYGLMAYFDSPEDLKEAARKATAEGYVKTDAYSPFPVEGLTEDLGQRPTRLPMIVLAAGLTGALTGFLMQYWMEVIAYPKNIGGRPLFSWPAFIPATYELTILFASFTAVIGMILLNGLPKPYHPVFNVPQFRHASRDGFFLVIEAIDPKFDRQGTKAYLESLNPRGVFEIEH
jgi:hypothetical protein